MTESRLVDLLRRYDAPPDERAFLDKNPVAVERKLVWIAAGGRKELQYKYVFWYDCILAFYYQYRRVMRNNDNATNFAAFCDALNADFATKRLVRYSKEHSRGYYDDLLRPYFTQIQSDPLSFAADSKISDRLVLLAKALDLINEKISSVERLEREETVSNEKKRVRNRELERALRVRKLAVGAANASNVAFDKG